MTETLNSVPETTQCQPCRRCLKPSQVLSSCLNSFCLGNKLKSRVSVRIRHNLGKKMNQKHANQFLASLVCTVGLLFSSPVLCEDSEAAAEKKADRVELEDGVLLVRAGYGLFVHDFLSGKTAVSALNRSFEPVKGSDVVVFQKPSIVGKGSMFLKKGYFSFTESKGVGQLAEALTSQWAGLGKSGCNALYRQAESDATNAISTCLNAGKMMCESAIERTQSWQRFDNCIAMEEQ